MATMEGGVRTHIDEFSCALCDNRAGLNANCCCPDDPEELFSVSEEQFRRRIGLREDQKLCSLHVKKLKRGLLFGRADWYECCAPFHVKSPKSSRLRPVPHSWKSYFESPSAVRNRYRLRQRICWECYMLAMEIINSGLEDPLEEENYQPESFDLGYMSPRRWASNLSLQQPCSPFGSQAGSTWSLAPSSHSQTSPSPLETKKIDDNANSDGKRHRLRAKFFSPSKSLDHPSTRDRILRVSRQASDAADSLRDTQRNLLDELSAAESSEETVASIDESTSFSNEDFIQIPEFTTPPENNVTPSPNETLLDEEGNKEARTTGKEHRSVLSHSTFGTLNSSTNLNAPTAREQTGMSHVSTNYASKVMYVSKYIKIVHADFSTVEDISTPGSKDSSSPEPGKLKRLKITPVEAKFDREKALDKVSHPPKQDVIKSTQITDENEKFSDKGSEDEVQNLPPDSSKRATVLASELPPENFTKCSLLINAGHDDPVGSSAENAASNYLPKNRMSSCLDLEEEYLASDEIGKLNLTTEEFDDGNQRAIIRHTNLANPTAANQQNQDNQESKFITETMLGYDLEKSGDYPAENEKAIEIEIEEARFDPIVCRRESDSSVSDKEESLKGSRNSMISDGGEKEVEKCGRNDNTTEAMFAQPSDFHTESFDPVDKGDILLDELSKFEQQQQLHSDEVEPAVIQTSHCSLKTVVKIPNVVDELVDHKTNPNTKLPDADSIDTNEEWIIVDEEYLSQQSSKNSFGSQPELQVDEPVVRALSIDHDKNETTLSEKLKLLAQENAKDVDIDDSSSCASSDDKSQERNENPIGSEGSSPVEESVIRALSIFHTENDKVLSAKLELLSQEGTRNGDIDESLSSKSDDETCDKKKLATKITQNQEKDTEDKEPYKSSEMFANSFQRDFEPSELIGQRSSMLMYSPEHMLGNQNLKPVSTHEEIGEVLATMCEFTPKDALMKNDPEIDEDSLKTDLYTELHGSKAEDTRESFPHSNGTDILSEDFKVEDTEEEAPHAPEQIPGLRSGNRADDGERLQFLRKRLQNRSCSHVPQPTDTSEFCGLDDNRPKITSYRTDSPPTNRRSLSRDKRRKLGVTFAIDPRPSIVVDKAPSLEDILNTSGKEKIGESSQAENEEEQNVDSSELARTEMSSDKESDPESRNESSNEKKTEREKSKEKAPYSESEDEDVSAVLSDVFCNVFTLKTISEFIQSFNTGSSLQMLVVTLFSTIVILLVLLAIFVFVL